MLPGLAARLHTELVNAVVGARAGKYADLVSLVAKFRVSATAFPASTLVWVGGTLCFCCVASICRVL